MQEKIYNALRIIKFWTCSPHRRSSYFTWHSTKEEVMEEAKRMAKTCDVKEVCNG